MYTHRVRPSVWCVCTYGINGLWVAGLCKKAHSNQGWLAGGVTRPYKQEASKQSPERVGFFMDHPLAFHMEPLVGHRRIKWCEENGVGWVEIYNSVVVVWRNNGFNAMVRPSAEESTGSERLYKSDWREFFVHFRRFLWFISILDSCPDGSTF